ncbi:MAG: alpha/beta hydrolase [Gemmatimonadetes bacterium]|nr:alpha/beta hydrolase [Gemmatimonadota bacterium]
MDVSTERLTIGSHALEVARIAPIDASRPTLVLLHEALGCVRRWKEWPEQLAAATGCGVLAYSRPGHGGSSRQPGQRPHDYLHREALEVLPEVLRQERVDSLLLVGHSDGASIATIYAGAAGDDRLCGVVQLAPHFIVEPEALVGIRAIREAWSTTNLRKRLRKYHGPNTDDLFRQWTETWLDPAFGAWSISDLLPRITVPMLLVQGDTDEYGTLAHFDLATQRVSAPLETVLLRDVGHSPHLDAAEETTRLVAAFVDRVTGARSPGALTT